MLLNIHIYVYTHIDPCIKHFYMEKKRMNRIFLCILINEQKFVWKIRCFKHQKQHNFAICDLFTLAPRFNQLLHIPVHSNNPLNSSTKRPICIDSVCLKANKASLVLSNFKVKMSASC